ncbi:MAG: RNA polymerase alpha subunit C-terminal domain-containing protein [Chitinophagaceae bacterium]
MPLQKTLRTCRKGHQYYKSTDCPTCPVCEAEKKPKEGFLSLFGAPARRALEARGIKTPKQLSAYSEKEILQLHGIGKSSIPIMIKAMKDEKLKFRSN